jgi:DASH complex subunit ASK1
MHTPCLRLAAARMYADTVPQFWKHFFEVSANVSLTTPSGDADAETAAAGEASALGTSTYDVDTSRDYADESAAGATPRAAPRSAGAKAGDAGGAGDETSQLEDIGDDSDDLDHSGFFQSLRHAKASSPAARGSNARQGGADDTGASWAPVESPFERLKKDVESQLGSRGDVTESSVILESHRAQRERAMRGETEQVRRGIEALHTGIEGSSSLAEPPEMSARPSAAAAPEAARRTPKKSTPLLRRVLANEQRRASPGGPIPRVTATPRGAAKRGNPFGPASARAQASSPAMEPPMSVRRWDGIADLRKTPLASARKIRSKAAGTAKGDKAQKGAKPDDWDDSDSDDEASLAWPAGMSPPVTMRFSVPQSRYHKVRWRDSCASVLADA